MSLRNTKADASSIPMRLRLFTFLVAFAVLWSGTGGSALACPVESPASIFLTVDAGNEFASTGDEDTERKSSPAGQAVAHHHCCTATPTVEAPFAVSLSLKEPPVVPSISSALISFAQAPPVQPPAA